ncbi:MAG: hypothetical protein EA422_05225 [Gemmatimonadales bacterium]|nr:MAG: hypothetical protein EA422_05225 [Gemmatimonadales bacterium]
MSTDSSPTLAHRLENAVVGTLYRVLRALPEPLALALGWGLGWFIGSVLRIRRSTVERNLAMAFPERDAKWRKRVAARVLPHIARESVMLLRLGGMSAEELHRRTEVDGLEAMVEATRTGQGVIIVTGHLGNWEIAGGAVAVRGLPLDVVAKIQKNPLVEERIRRMREALGMQVIHRHQAPREVLRSLRKGRAVALVADQDARSSGIFVDFFGVPASTARGPGLFAARTGSPVFLAVPERLPGLRGRYRVTFEPMDLPMHPDRDEFVEAFTRRYMSQLEAAIRRIPEQYFWVHRRWKTSPPPSISHSSPNG